MYKITILNPGRPQEIVTQAKQPTTDQLTKWVGGYFELIPAFNKYGEKRCTAYCNEEGKLQGMRVNAEAMLAWHEYLNSTERPWDRSRAVLVGPVVIVQREV